MIKPRIILIDDEEELRHGLAQGLELLDYEVEVFARPAEAIERASRDFYGVFVSDIRMPDMDGFDCMARVLDVDGAIPFVMITGHGDVPLAVQAMRSGPYDFLEKPFPTADLAAVVERAADKRRLVLENRSLRAELTNASPLELRLVGRNGQMEHLRKNIATLADTDADVLVLGETGAGKEVVARALHDFSTRAKNPFVAINCGALPAEIIESELFGHEPGAFTGATKKRIGKLEHADGGTVFLDEIESMPPDLQVKLLRVIETRMVEPLGSNREVPIDTRFIAATKDDLSQSGTDGRFRQDLYYRLSVVTLTLPPLRDRRDDIPLLFMHMLREARGRYRREFPEVTPELLAALSAHDWPGNVRELRNVADRFVLGLGTGLAEIDQASGEEVNGTSGDGKGRLAAAVAHFEKDMIAAELGRHDTIQETAEALGLSRKGLHDKLRRHGIKRNEDG